MTCCQHCQATRTQFGPKAARRDVQRYRKRGPDPTTRRMLDGIRATGLQGAHLLDVGGGVGVLHHELMGSVVDRVTHLDASPAYVGAAQREGQVRGYGERVDYLTGDAVALVDRLPTADLVTLDRVICCYPDWKKLVEASATRARRVYAFSMPRNRWAVRVATAIQNFVRRVRGNEFRTFVHSLAAVDGTLRDMGFRLRREERTPVWHVATYERIG